MYVFALRSNGQCAEPPRMVTVSHIELRGKRGEVLMYNRCGLLRDNSL